LSFEAVSVVIVSYLAGQVLIVATRAGLTLSTSVWRGWPL